MRSVSFGGEDESQPSTSNAKTFLDGSGAVNHASIPRKLRSAIKKRGRESVTSPLLFSRKQHDMSITADSVRRIGAKKSKLNKKKGHITKDEKEVAETLFALAAMFSDTNKADQQKTGDEKPEINPSDTDPHPQEETRIISSKVILESVNPSNLASSTAEEVISETNEAHQLELFSCKKAIAPNASGAQSDLSPRSASRTRVSTLDMNQSGDQEIFLVQVAASGFQYDKNCSSINLTATRAMSSEKPKSCPRSSRAKSRDTIFSSQPRVIENKTNTGEYTRVATKSSKSWKRCSAHVYISRLIKVLKISETEEGSTMKPTQLTACGGAELQPHLRVDGRNEGTRFSAMDIFHAKKDSSETQNGILHKRPIQYQQTASDTSAFCSSEQGYDFLSLGTGESANSRAESFLEPPKQYHMPYMQNQSSMLCSLPRNGYSSSLQSHNSPSEAHQQVQLSQYNSNFMQQKWAAQLQTHYSSVSKNGGVDSASVLNYAHSLFPHLHAALGSNYHHLPPPQHQLMLINTSLPHSSTKRRHNLPLGFERNGGALNPESMAAQLQLSCNQHL